MHLLSTYNVLKPVTLVVNRVNLASAFMGYGEEQSIDDVIS